MKKLILSKIAVAFVVLIFAFATAQNSVKATISAETRADNVGALNKNTKTTFKEDGSYMDKLAINFQATIDNVIATVEFNDDSDNGNPIKFYYAHLQVNDLFDGLLSFKFYDVGYGAGKGYSIRPDFGSHGLKVTVKPIDMLSISVAYGINNSTYYLYRYATNSGDAPMAVKLVDDKKGNRIVPRESFRSHAIQLDIGINNAFVPANVYFGVVIADGGDTSGLIVTNKADADAEGESSKIYHMSVGATGDLLAALLPGALKLDLGVVLPMGVAPIFYDPNKSSGEYERELNLVGILHGSLSDLGVEGLGLAYAISFALDTHTKQSTLGDLDDDIFKELVKVNVTPSYSLGQFKFALDFVFGMIGENSAMYAMDDQDGKATLYNKAYNRFEVTPSIKWTPASGNSVEGYVRYYNDNLDKEDNGTLRLGLKYNLTIGVEGI